MAAFRRGKLCASGDVGCVGVVLGAILESGGGWSVCEYMGCQALAPRNEESGSAAGSGGSSHAVLNSTKTSDLN